MASLVFNSYYEDKDKGNIIPHTDTFKRVLVTSSYVPNKDTHTKRSDVTNEITATGYTAGGAATTCTVSKDTATDKISNVFASTSWASFTGSAAGAVIYKSRGGASSADELVAYEDFGGTISVTGATFSVSAATIAVQN